MIRPDWPKLAASTILELLNDGDDSEIEELANEDL